MSNPIIDLHSHSVISDGTDTPSGVVERANANGVVVLALTDHDTVEGHTEALSAAERLGLRLVFGSEISTKNEGKSQHLLAYGFDADNEQLHDLMYSSFHSRETRSTALFDVFAENGFELDRDSIFEDVGPFGAPGRAHFGSALVRHGYAETVDEAFKRFLNKGQVGYIDRYTPDIEEAIAAVVAAGGKTVIAHCRGRKSAVTEERLAELQQIGLSGVEVYHQEHSLEVRSELLGIAGNLGLIVTGGSDYHGTRKINHELGVNSTPVDEFERLFDVSL